ncbi:hypothetical protein Tco_0092310 [Tanacetum coccineum]
MIGSMNEIRTYHGSMRSHGLTPEFGPNPHHLNILDYEWYDALEDSELKDKALRYKAIMEGFIKDDDDKSRYEQKRRWNTYTDYDDAYEINHEHNKCEELCEVHELSVCNIRRYMMIKYSFNDDEEYVAVKDDEYDDLTVTRKEACRAYQEIFQIVDEGWMVHWLVVSSAALSFPAAGKANVVADALSRKSGMKALFDSIILRYLERLDVVLSVEVLEAIVQYEDKSLTISDQKKLKGTRIVDFEKSAQDRESLEAISMITEFKVIDSPDGEYLIIYRANNHFRAFNTLWEILHILDRQDLYHLYLVVQDYYKHIPPTGLGLILLGDLTTIWETSATSDDDFWKNQEDWEIIRWRLNESSGVHTLELEDGTMLHMLAERRYPLSRELMIRMLDHGMEVEDESETAITLIHLFILWTTEDGDDS